MNDNVFLDTNLWVYFFAKDPLDKVEKIADIVNAQLPSLILSTQVFGKLYNVLTRKRIFTNTEALSIATGLASRTLVVDIRHTQSLASDGSQYSLRILLLGQPN